MASAIFSPQCDQDSRLGDDRYDRAETRTQAKKERRTASPHALITHRLLAKGLFPGTRRRFLLRLASSRPQLQKVQCAWRGLLTELALPTEVERALCGLAVEEPYEFLRSGNWRGYESALKRLGQDLASNNVPEEYAMAALCLFFEVCLCGLLSENPEDKEYALGLARLGSVSQLLVTSGYASHRAVGIRALEEELQKRATAPRRSPSVSSRPRKRRLAAWPAPDSTTR